WDKTTRDGIRSLSEKEQLQGRRLQEIAAEIATHPLLHDIAEELAEIGGAVRFDIPNSLNDAIPKQRDEAAKSLQDGINGIHAARDRLKRVIQQYQERAKIEQDLTELNRLALEAEELARQSQELKQDREGNQPEPGQTQDEFEKELKDREEHIQQEQKQLASDLEDLLKRRDELLQAARRSQLEKLEQIGKKAAQLAEDQQQVADGVAEESRDAARDASNLADRLQQMRNEAQQIQQQLQELQQAAAGPLDPQTDEATAKASSSSIDDAIRALRQGDLQDAQQDLEKLEEQLRQSASQLASNADRADSPRSEEADAAPDTGSSEQEKASEEARRIAKQLSDVRQQIEQLKESRGLSQQNPNEDGAQKTSRNDDQNNQARTSGSLEERAPGSSQASVEEDLIQRLRQLVDASAEIAEDVQQSASPPDAKTAAQAAADKARQSISEADAGQFSKAAGSMRESADQARQVVSQIEDGGMPDQQSQLTGIAAELNQLADVFDRLQQDNAAQLGAQQSSQQRLTNETQSLPAQLDELAERLNLEALGTQQQGRQAGEAARAAAEAADSTNQASEQLRQSQLQQASQSGHEAAGQLNRAAQLAQQGSQRPQDSNPVIPSEVGDSVTDALNNLKQAERPGQGNQSSPAGDQSSPNPASGTEASDEPSAQQGQPGQEQSQAGEGQQSPGDAAQQSSGQQPGSQGTQGADAASTSDSGAQQENQAGSNGADANGMTHSTDNLSKAAEALQNAAKGVLPADMTPGQMQESPGASGKAKAGTGNDQLFDGRTPGRTAGRGRGWFNPELNDDLEDGLSEQGREVIDSEYAELIRNYRRKLAQDRGKK
ncbi:MAG: hypothetical protein KDA91_01120, partial [Planctomycetaceae bacterium]|nr:hypothetical protein [Planctomycetaceae bacterium]